LVFDTGQEYPLQTGGSGLWWQQAQCIMGVEVFLPIWQKGRQKFL